MQITNDILTKTINNFKELYLSKKLILLEYYNSIIISISQNSSNYISDLNNALVDFKDVLDKSNTCIKNCDDILNLIKEDSDNSQEIDNLFNEIIDFTTVIDAFIKNNLLKSKALEVINKPANSEENTTVENIDVSQVSATAKITETIEKEQEIDKELIDNNVLLISEKINKVFLPYKVSDLKEILKDNNSYKSLQKLINDKYTIPLSNFQNPVVSRFREAFSLVKDREKRKCAFCY